MDKKDKYLYFDTTIRNPLRLKFFLKSAINCEGQTLTNDLCVEIVKEFIKNMNTAKSLKEIFNNNISQQT